MNRNNYASSSKSFLSVAGIKYEQNKQNSILTVFKENVINSYVRFEINANCTFENDLQKQEHVRATFGNKSGTRLL